MDGIDVNGLNVYGRALLGKYESVKRSHGRDGIDDVFREMIKKGYDGPSHTGEIEYGEKYPFEHMLIFLKSYLDLYGERDFDMMSKRAPNMKETMGWYVKWSKKPRTLLKKSKGYWTDFYDFGRLEGKKTGSGEGVLKGFDICVATPLFCRSLTNYFEGVMETIDIDAEAEHTKCSLKGDHFSEWKIKW
ncbi:MAG: hypothetical protein ACQESD_00970 [Thermoplasmatota archaeon]